MGQLLIGGLLAAAAVATQVATAPPRLHTIYDIDAGIGAIRDVAFSSDGRLLAAAGVTGFGAWDAQTGDPIRIETSGGRRFTRVAIAGAGIQLAVGGADGRVTIVDLRTGLSREGTRHRGPVTALALSRDGRIGASGDGEGNVLLWDPDTGPLGPLQDGGHRGEVLVVAFNAEGHLLSASKDLRLVMWDVSSRRPLRRGSLQSEIAGRALAPRSAGADMETAHVVIAAQSVSEPRGGMFTDRSAMARPGDLRRENHLVPYTTASGMSGAPIRTGDFGPERIAVSPLGCFAFFTSQAQEQARLHVWSLLKTGDDLARAELQAPATALALDGAGRFVAVATDSGRIRTWRVSGATHADCQDLARAGATRVADPAAPSVVPGSETDPLIQGAAGLSVAVLRFDVTALDPTLGDGVAEMVAGQLANTKGLSVVERSQIDALVRELELQRSGLTAADAVRIGRGVNARKVILGSVRKLGESTLMLTARLVDVETQQIEGFREVQCRNCREPDLPAAVEALRRILVR